MGSDKGSLLTVRLNGTPFAIPRDVEPTPTALLEAADWPAGDWIMYRSDFAGHTITDEHRCSEPLVVDDGDEFVVVPRYDPSGSHNNMTENPPSARGGSSDE